LANRRLSVPRKLAQLVRPSFVAAEGCCFDWSDLSMIEAVMNPYLAASPDAERVLNVFRASFADRTQPDVYTVTAAGMEGITDVAGLFARYKANEPEAVRIRSAGKVATLALGFGGAVGALRAMGVNYGMRFDDDEEAADTVRKWRATNRWAPRFWGKHNEEESYGLWGAIHQAMQRPGELVGCGRVAYVYLPDYLGKSLLCRLPSGRMLTYRAIRWERVDILDEATDEIVGVETQLRFARGYGRVKFWAGMACENVVQGAAADLLRGIIRRLVEGPTSNWLRVVGHTHDEIITEVPVDRAAEGREILHAEMVRGFDWAPGLPLAAEETTAYFYSKAKASIGL